MANREACVACCSLNTIYTGGTQPVEVCGEMEDRPEIECTDCGCTWAE